MTRFTSPMKKWRKYVTVRYFIAIPSILILLGFFGYLVFKVVQCKNTCGAVPACNASASGDPSVFGVVSNITHNPANIPSSMEVTMNRFQLQQAKLKTIPDCKPMLHPITLTSSEELDSLDELRDKDLLPSVVPVNRCPYSCGLCLQGHCQSTKNANTTVIVQYKDGDNVKEVERQLVEHLNCTCQ